ncbi:MAG: alpha-rhamnosidase, partial [Tannerellaceae bacterium]|nr:alpha-rhamnosidase [Tannerellaceae bacterium]
AVGGIRPDEANPGYRHVFIDPQIPQGVTWAKTTKESPYGTMRVDWALESTSLLKVNITLPVGVQGTFVIPGKTQSCKVDDVETTDLQNIVLENGDHEIIIDYLNANI